MTRSLRWLVLPLTVAAVALATGCAVVTVAGVAAGAAVTVGGLAVDAAVGTAKVGGAVIGKTVDVVTGGDSAKP